MPPDPLFIRPAADHDRHALIDLKWQMNLAEHAALPEGSSIAPMLDLSREAAERGIDGHWRDMAAGEGAWFVGECEGAVIATARWALVQLSPAFKPARVGMVATVVVAERMRGRGFGKLIMAHVTQDMRAHGVEYACLEVVQGNAAAQKLYEAAGFAAFELFMLKRL